MPAARARSDSAPIVRVEIGHKMPIIMLAGSDIELDILRGLDADAND